MQSTAPGPLPAGLDVLFVATALAFNLLIAGLFVAERHGRTGLRDALGRAWLLLAIPLAITAIGAAMSGAGWRTLAQFALALVYMAVEFMLDHVLRSDFRKHPAQHAAYILLEYAGLFSLIGIAFSIGQTAGILVAAAFWTLMGALVYLYWPRRRAGV